MTEQVLAEISNCVNSFVTGCNRMRDWLTHWFIKRLKWADLIKGSCSSQHALTAWMLWMYQITNTSLFSFSATEASREGCVEHILLSLSLSHKLIRLLCQTLWGSRFTWRRDTTGYFASLMFILWSFYVVLLLLLLLIVVCYYSCNSFFACVKPFLLF